MNRQLTITTEPIDEAVSKLVMSTLADADWAKSGPPLDYQGSPPALFSRLGLTEKDGWVPPKDPSETQAAAKKWLQENSAKYRIQRFVAEKE